MALAGNLIGGRLVGFAATFLMAISPLHVYFSREGRPYSLIILLALILLLALLLRGSRRGVALAYGGSLTAAYVGIHTLPILLAFCALSAVALLGGLRKERKLWRSPFLHYLVGGALALAIVFGLYMTRSQTNTVDFEEIRSPVYISPLSERAMERFLASMTTSGHQSVLPGRRSWVLIGFSVIGLLAGLWKRQKGTLATAGMFFLPACLSILALVSVGRWYGLRYTCSALPAFLLLVALGMGSLSQLLGRWIGDRTTGRVHQPVAWFIAAALLLVLAAPNWAAARTDSYRKLDWQGVAAFFEEIAIEGEPIVVPNSWAEICLGYYLRDSERDFPFLRIEESVSWGQKILDSTPRGWLLTAGFRRSGETRAWMHRFQPVLKKREEELALFYFPGFVDLLSTRFPADKGGVFERQFEANGRRFDFGGAELTLQGKGWSFHEENKAGIRYQWAMGEQAELGLPLGSPTDSTIRFRALPFMYPDAPAQTLEVWLNDSHLATLDLPRGWSEHEVPAPVDVWSSGANILYLRFSRSTIPAELDRSSKDRRPLAAAFDYLELQDASN
jgi:hypothetical protein